VNAARIQEQAFAEGLERQLVKSALNPRVLEETVFDPRRTAEYAALGKSIFNKSYKNPNPLSGLLAAGSAGYGQLRDLHKLRSSFIQSVIGMREAMGNHPAGSPSRAALEQAIQTATGAFRHNKQQALARIGATAEPRLKFFRTTLPTAAGLGAGAAGGYAAGNMVGDVQAKQDVAGAPLSSRLSYLFNPQNLPSSPPPPQAAPIDGSIQDNSQ